MVDLHGLRVEEALEYAKLAFEAAALQEDEDDKEVRFIVGTSSLRPPRRVLMVNCRRIQARDYMRRMVGPKFGQRWKNSVKSTFGVLYCSHSLFLYSHLVHLILDMALYTICIPRMLGSLLSIVLFSTEMPGSV